MIYPKMTICEAIARQEGFYSNVPIQTRAQRNHNPGNICWGTFALRHGAIRIEIIPPGLAEQARFAYFPSDQIGFNAMSALLEAMYTGLSLAAAISKWAPPSENNTPLYISNVSEWTTVSPDTILNFSLLAPPNLNQGLD